MGTIHMEVEQVRELASQMSQWAERLLSRENTLRSVSGSLSIAWQGGRSDEVKGNLTRLIKNYSSLMQQLQDLSVRLSRESDEWAAADSDAYSAWKELNGNLTPPAPITPGGLTEQGGDQESDAFNWWSAGESGIDGAGGILELIGTILKEGSPLAKTLKNINGIGTLLGIAVGVISDLQSGRPIGEAVISEIVEAVFDQLVYLVPGLGQLYAVYNITLAVVQLIAAVLDLSGMHDAAVMVQNAAEFLDIGENIGNAIGDFVGWLAGG